MNLQSLRAVTTLLVRNDGPDLSARQMGVFLNAYLSDGPHTVRGLAETLNISKPAVSRALDRLEQFDLIQRKTDPDDRRSVMAQRTEKGEAFLKKIDGMIAKAMADDNMQQAA